MTITSSGFSEPLISPEMFQATSLGSTLPLLQVQLDAHRDLQGRQALKLLGFRHADGGGGNGPRPGRRRR